MYLGESNQNALFPATNAYNQTTLKAVLQRKNMDLLWKSLTRSSNLFYFHLTKRHSHASKLPKCHILLSSALSSLLGNGLHVLLKDLVLQTLTFRKAWNLGFCFSHLVIVSLLISKKFTNGGYVFNKSFDWKKQLLWFCFTYYVALYICSYALSHRKLLKGTFQ